MIIVVMGKSTQSYVRIFGLILDIVRENFTMEHFGLVSEYALTGDQPQAICFAPDFMIFNSFSNSFRP